MTFTITPFEATVRRPADTDFPIIDLRGDIDDRAAEPLNRAYVEAIESSPARVLLNFADVHYINSKGIALIVGVLTRARKERREIIAAALTAHYREIFEITSLSDFMTIVPDESSLR